jgi:DNA-binding HxlR family transcriptional regulator
MKLQADYIKAPLCRQERTLKCLDYAEETGMAQLQSEISVLDETCPARQALNLVAGKWIVLIVYALADGPSRFNQLQRTIGGITQKMLTQSLRRLEYDGLITRKVHPTVPPQVEYELTPLGGTLVQPLNALCQWAETYYGDMESRRAARRS